MKLITFLVLITAGCCAAQDNEFKTYSNGLIYDPATMSTLGHIVDSLNIKFRACDLSHPYKSNAQGFGSYVEVPSKAARKLIESGIAFEEYEKKYPRSVEQQNVWITRVSYRNYNDVPYLEYATLPGKQQVEINIKNKRANNKTSGWIISEEGTEAFYLRQLTSQDLPFDYARLVQYVDCMIDTTAQIFFPEAEAQVYQQVDKNSKASQFITWAESFPGRPEYPDYDKTENFDSAYAVYDSRNKRWDSLRMVFVDEQMKKSVYQRSLLMDARDESVANTESDARLEFYVARYLSAADALKLMRSRRVRGNCSQDQSPRYHAMNICKLAAETAQWDIFLRSHLDIMNDRFERQSDGSYAWAGRKTYLKELEELDINAIDLLLGTSLRVSNVSDNHYWGSIGRTGRALADAADKDALEKRLVAMIADEQLDVYNRVLIVYLFDNYVYNLDAGARKTAGEQTIKTAVASLPEHMRRAVSREND